MNASSALLLLLLASPQEAEPGAAAAEAPGAEDADGEPSPGQASAQVEGGGEGKGKEECKVAIMNLQSKGLPENQKHVAMLLTDTMAAELQSQGTCKVITQSDIMQMLDFEASKAAVCTDESDSCLAEIGGALGVDRVIGGSLSMLGSSFKLSVKLQNIREGKVEARVDELIKGEPELLDLAARDAARVLFGGEKSAPAKTDDADNASAGGKQEGDGQTASAQADKGGGALGTVLLTLGLVGAGGGFLVAVVGGAAAGFIEATLNFPAIPFPKDLKPILPIAGIAGVGAAAVGVAVLVVGGALTAGSFLVE